MATPDVTAGTVMDGSAGLLNDINKTQYTYAIQLPYLKMALRDLRIRLERSQVSVAFETSAVLNVPAGTTEIGFNTTPALPSTLIAIQQLWERAEGINPFVPMVGPYESLSHNLEAIQVSSFGIWAWSGNKIKLLSALRDNDIKIDYISEIFGLVIDENSILGVINAQPFLEFRTAAFIAKHVEENDERANDLNSEANLAFDNIEGIEASNKQSTGVRRQPFRAGYKRRCL